VKRFSFEQAAISSTKKSSGRRLRKRMDRHFILRLQT
jgi:hypothetical protein